MDRSKNLVGYNFSNLPQNSNLAAKKPFLLIYPRAVISLTLALLLVITTLVQSVLFIFDTEIASADNGLNPGAQARVANTDGDGVRLRSEPDSKANSILTLSENWLVTIKGGPFSDKQGNSFYKVEWSNRTGYAMTQYLAFAGKTVNANISSSSSSASSKNLPVGGQARISGTDWEGVRMRQQPNAGSSTLTILNENYLVTVLGGPFHDNLGNNFFRVEWAGYTGYVSGGFLNSAPKNAVAGTGGTVRVTNTDGDAIRFRSGPSRQGEANGYVYEGQVLKFLAGPFKDAEGNNWYKLDRNGEVGYVDASFVRRTDQPVTNVKPVTSTPVQVKSAAPAAAPATSAPQAVATPKPKQVPAPASNGGLGDRIASYAKQFLGWRYVWGGHSPDAGGFDCSGLVHWVLTQNGIEAGYSVDADLNIGSPVSFDQLQPGDILIWVNTYKPGPSHSGIYIGGGRFVHAGTDSTGVTINNLSDSYYASRYYGARRPGA